MVFHYQPARYRVENNGHALQATPEGGSQFVRIGGESFALKQFHFTRPASTFKGRHFPLEAHFVHQSTQSALATWVSGSVWYRYGQSGCSSRCWQVKPGQTVQLPRRLDISKAVSRRYGSFPPERLAHHAAMQRRGELGGDKMPVAAAEAQLRAAAAIIGHPNRPSGATFECAHCH